MDLYDVEAIENWLLSELQLVLNYRKHCERQFKKTPCGTARMERLKAIVMRDHLKLQLEKLQSIKEGEL